MPLTAAGRIRKNMTFGTALPTAPPSGTSTCPAGRVRLGEFFDGTDNNAWRDWGKGFLDWKPGSKEPNKAPDVDKLRPADPGTTVKEEKLNGPTNVARLYYLFQEEACCQKRIYATGVGGGDPDTNPGKMFWEEAASGLGGRARINWGIAWVTDFVNRNSHHLAVEKRIDTFGFSRGSTQARDFLNKILAARIENRRLPPSGHRYEVFVPSVPIVPIVHIVPIISVVPPVIVKIDTYPEMRGILFEYLGIMDTVASEGLGTIAQFGDWLAEYNLAVLGRPKQADKKPKEILAEPSDSANVVHKEGWVHWTYHQVADDEFRDVFALEPLGNNPASWWRSFRHLPENMREQSYPGCHADIGGGYRNSPAGAAIPPRELKLPLGLLKDKGIPIPMTGTPAVAPMFINISNLTLQHMVEDALKAGVPLNDPSTLPRGLHEIDPVGADESVPKLSELYEKYCQLRATLIKKHAADCPKWADYTHDIVKSPVYLQSYPDLIYRAIATELHQDPVYVKLRTYYVHDSSADAKYKWGIDPVRRLVRAFVPLPAPLAVRFLIASKRDIRQLPKLFSGDRQRDVHYHGFQNSYDHECDNGKSER